MKRMSFERPTEHYDERIFPIDEQICELLKQRKEISNNNPGYPQFEYIEKWAISFNLYEDFLKSVFYVLRNEEKYQPTVEPIGFRKHVPILKSKENEKLLYTVTSMRQYSNASVIIFNIDWDVKSDHTLNKTFELYLGENYYCRMDTGGGSSGHLSFSYVVSPALPDDIAGMEFTFREIGVTSKDKPGGNEIVF
ncbi:hypothetical protein HZF08_02670 [Paenibacillus sp. CGMCC 1.16610]|uniref:Uncharacterized protein n=2 Tax=Paenibacillus TaxID=44249 RepID=A0ABW9UA31_9BACL|nr:hypothetical protein [Paenibacillus anseongense]MBA2937195.1 hypothetical protein [Paenibacillus sp. CGMCC 1.16610]MVQ36256.1 hypothetical protein [Paenibacillus anseongense]